MTSKIQQAGLPQLVAPDSLVNRGMNGFLRRRRNSCPNHVQVDVHAADHQRRKIKQANAPEPATPEMAVNPVFLVGSSSYVLLQFLLKPGQTGQSVSPDRDALFVLQQAIESAFCQLGRLSGLVGCVRVDHPPTPNHFFVGPFPANIWTGTKHLMHVIVKYRIIKQFDRERA
jgi:hypothetical protein